jgi:peptide/nickel transport system substrate-binding protein
MLQRRNLFVSLGLLLLIAACSPEQSIPDAKNSIVYGLTLSPSGFDPHIHQAAEIGIVLRQVYDTLVYRDPETGEIVPGLATEWSVSDDSLTYTFKLRQDVKFHDGTPFDAQAVAANLDRIQGLGAESQKAIYLLGPYSGYEIVDNYTIRIKLREPFSPLLDSFAQIYLAMASPTAFKQYSNNRYQYHQVGTGPFTFVEYLPQDRIVLRRNDDYQWGPRFYEPLNEQSVDEIVFRFFTDPPTRSVALENGNAQVMGELLPTDAQAMRANSRILLEPVTVPGQPLQFLMNTARFPTDNLTVRQSILLGTNRSAIVDSVFQGFSPVAWGPLSAATLFYNPDLKGAYAYDSGQARTLLTAIGYTDNDNNGFLELNGVELEITVITPSWGLIPEVAQLLQDQWRTVGIRANLVPVALFSALREEVLKGEYNLVAFNTFGLDPGPLLNQYYASDGVTNWTGFRSSELDNMLREAMRQNDGAVRANLYHQAQRIIMENALVLPIRDYVNLNAHSSSVRGLTFDSYGWFPLLHNVTLSPS